MIDEQKGYIKLIYLGIGLGRAKWKEIAERNEFKNKQFKVTDKTKENEFVKAMLGVDKQEIMDENFEDLCKFARQVINKYKKIIRKEIKEGKIKEDEIHKLLEKEFKFDELIKFCEWYLKPDKKCHYCETSQDKLKKLFESGKISSKKTSFTATLQIERKNPNRGYTTENCVLACCLCNNAKSDMISYCNYKKYFAPKMKEFLEYLSDDGKNEMDKTTDQECGDK